MATKLTKNEYPANHTANDFKAFGPPAVNDGDFETVKIADLGCFKQGDVDSNKYFHGAIVQSTKTNQWFVYFEWGRTGATNPTFQFIPCSSEQEAQKEFAKQLHSKNDKRGEWTTIAGIRTLRAKGSEDCYLVRPQATRSTGLPDAKTIKLNEGKDVKKTGSNSSSSSSGKSKVDSHTFNLLKDLNIATVTYTRGVMADASLPTQKAIDEARDILTATQKRLLKVGDDIKDQLADSEIIQLTSMMYSRIPKKKQLKAAPETWLLTKDNIMLWQADLDAFESSLYSSDNTSELEADPYNGMPLTMEWVDPKTSIGTFLYKWWPNATANKHGYLGNMKIKNIWKIDRNGDSSRLNSAIDKVNKEVGGKKIKEKPLFQPERVDLPAPEAKKFAESNTSLLFHGSRSVNISGILRESLRLPKNLTGVVITGALIGPGCYFADDWKKSAGYTSLSGGYYTYGSGGVNNRGAFMFAADVVCGNPYAAPASYGYISPPSGHHSVFGKANFTSLGGYSKLQNNEIGRAHV